MINISLFLIFCCYFTCWKGREIRQQNMRHSEDIYWSYCTSNCLREFVKKIGMQMWFIVLLSKFEYPFDYHRPDNNKSRGTLRVIALIPYVIMSWNIWRREITTQSRRGTVWSFFQFWTNYFWASKIIKKSCSRPESFDT